MVESGRVLVAGEAVSWVDVDGWPPVLRVRLTDAYGREWIFVDKTVMFVEELDLSVELPVPVGIVCIVVAAVAGRVVVEVYRGYPQAEDGTTRFTVRDSQVATPDRWLT